MIIVRLFVNNKKDHLIRIRFVKKQVKMQMYAKEWNVYGSQNEFLSITACSTPSLILSLRSWPSAYGPFERMVCDIISQFYKNHSRN